MARNLHGRSVLKELDFTPDELRYLLALSADLKAAKYGGYERRRLEGKEIALIFEKSSTRTMTSFEVGGVNSERERPGSPQEAGIHPLRRVQLLERPVLAWLARRPNGRSGDR